MSEPKNIHEVTLVTSNLTDKVTGASIMVNKTQTGNIFDLWCWLIGSYTEPTLPWYRPQDEPDTKIKVDVGYWSSDTFVKASAVDLVYSEVFGQRTGQWEMDVLLRSIDKHLIPGVLEKNMVIVFPGETSEPDVMCVTDGEVCTFSLIE